MRVLHVLATLSLSGAERMLEVVGPLAVADGISSTILSTGEVEIGPFAPRLAAAGYGLRHVPFSRGLSFLRRLAVLLRTERFDVVHVHCERASFWIEVLAWAAGARRIIRTFHNAFPFEGGLRWRRSAQRAIARCLLGVAGIATSQSVVDNERRRFANPVQLIPPWVDPAFHPPSPDERAAARRRLELHPGMFAVACVGGCSVVKNHAGLIGAVARLARDGRDVVLLHAGSGPLEAEERALAAAMGITDRVRFLGPVQDVRGVLHAADIYAMPSRYEGLPIAGLEALACGLPAVLTDVDGLRDLRDLQPEVRWVGLDEMSIARGLSDLAGLPDGERQALAAGAVLATQRHHAAIVGWSALRDLYTAAHRARSSSTRP